jgi:hypothetical protein
MASPAGTGMGWAGAISAARRRSAGLVSGLVSGLCLPAMITGGVTAARSVGPADDAQATAEDPGANE